MYTVDYTMQSKRAVKRCVKRGLDVNRIADLVDIDLQQEVHLEKTFKL